VKDLPLYKLEQYLQQLRREKTSKTWKEHLQNMGCSIPRFESGLAKDISVEHPITMETVDVSKLN
jgi:hypothetical protein